MQPDHRFDLSVALCTYNGERYVRRQVASILAQDRPVQELIVSDDASTDGTLAEVERAVADSGSDIRVRVLRNPTSFGTAANFEQAIAACAGPLVALSDQDDVWHPGRTAAILPFFENDDVALVHTDAELVDGAGRPLGATLLESLAVSPATIAEENTGDALGVLLRRNIVTGATVVLRRSLLDRARPFPRDWVHDEWLAVCAALTRSLRCLPETTIDYRQHGGNQIGVSRPTLRYKLSRLVAPGEDRQRRLAGQFAVLAERSAEMPLMTPGDLARIRAKAAFEDRRALLPAGRLARAVPVLRLARSGDYGRFASQGRLDILRDLLRRS